MGSLASHFFALVFKMFGYSMGVLKSATLLFYLAFMVVQFLLLKEIFSFAFALAVTFFYSLPMPQLITASLDNTSAYPLVLFFGATLLYLSYRIASRGQENLIPWLGFMAGLAFWTHQITAAFILTSLLNLLFRLKFRIKTWALLLYSGMLGFLPQLFVEVMNRFSLVSFLAPQKSAALAIGEKVRASLPLLASLLGEGGHPWRYFLLILVLAGFLILSGRAVKAKRLLPEAMFSLLFLVFYLVYIFSHFSERGVVRYLYPLFVCLPVLMLAPFQVLKSKWRNFLLPGLVVAVFLGFNLKESLDQVKRTADRDFRIRQTATAMEGTGRRYWLADYWTAYLFTAVSAERLIVDSYTIKRYPAYSLAYWNNTETAAYIFLFRDVLQERDYEANLQRWLRRANLGFKKREARSTRLFYEVRPRLHPRALNRIVPSSFPQLELAKRAIVDGYFQLTFQNKEAEGTDDFRLIAGIPGFSSVETTFSGADQTIWVAIPVPRQQSFRVRYYLDYRGVPLTSSVQEFEYGLSDISAARRKAPLVFLEGVGPEFTYQGKKRRICTKKISLEFNPEAGYQGKLRFFFFSPFRFSSWRWYGKYAQSVRVEANGQSLIEAQLKDGENILDLVFPKNLLKESGNLITLEFRHHLWYFDYPFWLVSTFLDRIELE